jgi:Zn-dependent protease
LFGFGPDMIFRIPALLIALTVHEYAHARVAVALGDPTPRYAGRVTLNPLAHLDWLGLLMLWIASFGWAKPVPFNPYNLRNGRTGTLYVALAGPAANIITAFITMLIFGVLLKMKLLNTELFNVIHLTYSYNLGFAIFNLIPLPPLDGSKIVSSLLPGRQAYAFERIAPYGPFILIALLFTNLIGIIITPFISAMDQVIRIIVSLIL